MDHQIELRTRKSNDISIIMPENIFVVHPECHREKTKKITKPISHSKKEPILCCDTNEEIKDQFNEIYKKKRSK